MKRKLNEKNSPQVVSNMNEERGLSVQPTFDEFGFDARLLQAIAKEKYSSPTAIQARAIPLALAGKDVLARARTGSGKTAAYILPILHSILKRKSHAHHVTGVSALILVPTKELASQVTEAIAVLSAFCSKDVHCVNLTHQIAEAAQRVLLSSAPDIVVSTPSRASLHLNTLTLVAADLSYLVVDEADLVLSYEYDEDLKNLISLIPNGVQTFLASATLTSKVYNLAGLFCRDPVVIDLEEEEKESNVVSQYVVKCGEDEKFLLIFALFKLKLVKGKAIIFVGDIDRCYRVKLFLEQFGIKSCVLNSELPLNSRIHIVDEFNKNVYDIIIATDEQEVNVIEETDEKVPASETMAGSSIAELPVALLESGRIEGLVKERNGVGHKKSTTVKKDREYGVARGVDFHNVACVLNFDLPLHSRSYIHRIGRTARAGRTGIALSFAVPAALYHKHKATTFPSTKHDEEILAKITRSQQEKGQDVQPYHFDLVKLDGFRYRVTSALKAVTPSAIREARLRELREEMLKSEKLKRHLEENPEDLRYLRHDTELRPAKVMPHMRHVPEYLVPAGQGQEKASLQSIGFVGIGRRSENRIRQARARNRMRGRARQLPRGMADPLKTFNVKVRK